MFLNKKKEIRVKFNPRLSANRPSNNWAQVNITAVPSLKLPELDLRERNYLIQVNNMRFPNYP